MLPRLILRRRGRYLHSVVGKIADRRLSKWPPMLLIFSGGLLLVPGAALGKGGTNIHEGLSVSRAGVPTIEPPSPNESFGGCGRGRYRDAHTRKCRGPADFGN
jgi:hypothetical protein